MEKLKSLKSFVDENPEIEKLELNAIQGGITADTAKFYCKDTLDEWNCVSDNCSYAVGDGMYGSDCP